MKQFVEKLIERLQESGKKMCEAKSSVPLGKHSSANHRYYKAISVKKAIEIVNQLAEEYNNDKVNQIAMMYAKSISKYGVDIGAKWETATQQSMELSQAYMRGRQDERDKFAKWQDEQKQCND